MELKIYTEGGPWLMALDIFMKVALFGPWVVIAVFMILDTLRIWGLILGIIEDRKRDER
jgi:hypothetical protein